MRYWRKNFHFHIWSCVVISSYSAGAEIMINKHFYVIPISCNIIYIWIIIIKIQRVGIKRARAMIFVMLHPNLTMIKVSSCLFLYCLITLSLQYAVPSFQMIKVWKFDNIGRLFVLRRKPKLMKLFLYWELLTIWSSTTETE